MVRDYRTQSQVEQTFVEDGDFTIYLMHTLAHHHYATQNDRGTLDEIHIVVYDVTGLYLVLM